jgi:hypothetical protein
MQNQTQSPLQKTISQNSLTDSKSGEPIKSVDQESLQQQLPTGEEMLKNSKQLPPRILKISQQDFYQWRQLLGLYKKQTRERLAMEIEKMA